MVDLYVNFDCDVNCANLFEIAAGGSLCDDKARLL